MKEPHWGTVLFDTTGTDPPKKVEVKLEFVAKATQDCIDCLDHLRFSQYDGKVVKYEIKIKRNDLYIKVGTYKAPRNWEWT